MRHLKKLRKGEVRSAAEKLREEGGRLSSKSRGKKSSKTAYSILSPKKFSPERRRR